MGHFLFKTHVKTVEILLRVVHKLRQILGGRGNLKIYDSSNFLYLQFVTKEEGVEKVVFVR